MFACSSGVIVLPSLSVKTDWSFMRRASFFMSVKPSVLCMIGLDVVSICFHLCVISCCNFDGIGSHLPFGCSVVVGRSSACLQEGLQEGRQAVVLAKSN